MWNALGKSLLALIAAMLVADPVIACCFPTMIDTTAATAQSDVPPCHGDRAEPPARKADATDTSCPGCGDCAAAMAATDAAQSQGFVPSQANDDDDTGHYSATVDSLVPPPFPPPLHPVLSAVRPPHSADTPVSLRQRLLI